MQDVDDNGTRAKENLIEQEGRGDLKFNEAMQPGLADSHNAKLEEMFREVQDPTDRSAYPLQPLTNNPKISNLFRNMSARYF